MNVNLHHKKPTVILLHGLHQRHWVMLPLARKLRQAGYQVHCFNYWSMMQPIERHSQRLHQWLSKHHEHHKSHDLHNASHDIQEAAKKEPHSKESYNQELCNQELDNQKPYNKEPLHLIGHSLGGLVIRDFLNRYPMWQVDKCLTLGTPHLGSITAKYFTRYFAPAVAKAYPHGLDGTAMSLPDGVCMGVIAGNKPHAVGKVFMGWHKQSNAQYLSKLTQQYDIEHASLDRHSDNAKDNVIDDYAGTVFVAETMLPNASDHIVLPVSHTGMLMDKKVAQQSLHFLQNGCFYRTVSA